MRHVAIDGAGVSPFGEHVALGLEDLLPPAFADPIRSVDNDPAAFQRQATRPGTRRAALGDAATQHGSLGGPGTRHAAQQCLMMANMTPSETRIPELGDSVPGDGAISYEDHGFADRLDGYELAEAEVTSVGGALPVNPSGGLASKGHPPGATGVAQCVELFQQLRGEAFNQVDGARVALAHNAGGATAVASVTILEGPGGYDR